MSILNIILRSILFTILYLIFMFVICPYVLFPSLDIKPIKQITINSTVTNKMKSNAIQKDQHWYPDQHWYFNQHQISGENKNDAWVYAKVFIKNKLTVPSTADFNDGFSDLFYTDYQNYKEQVSYEGNNIYIVNGWVNAQNKLKMQLKIRWLIAIKEDDNKWIALDGPYLFD